MSLSAIASRGLQQAYQQLETQGRSVIEKGPEPESIVGVKKAERDVEISAKLLKVDNDLTGTLLDILA